MYSFWIMKTVSDHNDKNARFLAPDLVRSEGNQE